MRLAHEPTVTVRKVPPKGVRQMASARLLRLPDHPLWDRRSDWSLAQFTELCAAQVVPAADVLGECWDLLEEPDRPDGVSHELGSSAGRHLVCRCDSRVVPGALTNMLIIN